MMEERETRNASIQVRCAEDVRHFLNRLGHREEFEVTLQSTYPRAGWNGAGNIVWIEGLVGADSVHFEFFYDDGQEPEWDEDGEPIEGTNDYPSIICTVADIVSLRRICSHS